LIYRKANAITTVARVKKIIHADDEIQNCSNNAAFVITIATEMFVQHLVEKTHEIIKAEKRPRRNVQYSDVGKFSFDSFPRVILFHESSVNTL
jgi:hypothetical protein